MQDKVFVDSNIFLYAFTHHDSDKQSIASTIILDAGCCISTQVINEVSNNLIKKLSFLEADVVEFINSCYDRYTVFDLSQSLFITASSLRKQYNFSFYDSLIVSAALQSQATVLYSEDMQDNLIVSNCLTITNPFK